MTARLNPESRRTALAAMAGTELDVLVLGGGVVGAGTALDLVSRGLSVGLVELRDWASGTSSRSSKLIHGGLAYLGRFELGRVREALRERALLFDRIAPHLVRRVPFLYPLHGHAPERAYVGAGMLLYDALGRGPGQPRVLPIHRHLALRAVRRVAPALRLEHVTGAVQYFDAQVDDARFVLTLVRTAAAYGTLVANRIRATELITEGDRVVGARVRDEQDGAELVIRARVVVSATGVWTGRLLRELAPDGAELGFELEPRKGVHLVVPRDRIRSSTAVVTRTGNALLFMIPWGRHWIIGTTDTRWELDLERPAASARDIDDLLARVNQQLVSPLTPDDVEGCFAGLRPVLRERGRRLASLPGFARDRVVRTLVPGLVVVAGGQLTTYRVLAAAAGDEAARGIGGLVEESITQRLPLLGADGFHARWNQRHLLARQAGLRAARVEHLLQRYGSVADELLEMIIADPRLGEPVPGAEDYLAAEIAYAATHEGALQLTDVLARRTRISFETKDRGAAAAPHAARLMAEPLGWDQREVSRQIGVYLRRVEAERASQTKQDDWSAVAALAETRPR